MDKIQKFSLYFVYLLTALTFFFPACILLQWFCSDTFLIQNVLVQNLFQQFVRTPEGFTNLNTIQWATLTKAIRALGDAVGVLPFFLSLFSLRRIFNNYHLNQVFNTDNTRQYRYLGSLFFLDALIAKPLSNMLLVLATTLSNAPGHRYITVSFGTPNLKALFCGFLLIFISWVMLRASKLQEEQTLTI